MKIGFDFDRVFISYPPLIPNFLIDVFYKGSSYFKKENKKSELSYRFPGKMEQQIRVLSHAPFLRQPIEKNVAALKKICKQKNCNTYLVSSRFGFLKKRTDNLLAKEKLLQYFDGVYFNYENLQPHKFKEEVIKRLHIDTYIDDDLDLAIYLSEHIPSLKVFWLCSKKQINQKAPKAITVISDLDEFIEKYM